MSPKISVIVPIYNSESKLQKCLDSIKDQTFIDFEVIMINDGSTDNSEFICLNFSKNDSRFKYFKQENQGKSAAVNLGIKQTKGVYLSIIDSDDYISNETFSIAIDVSEKFHVDIVNFSYYYIKNGVKEKNSIPFPKNKVISNEDFKKILKSDFPNKKMLLWFTAMNLIKKELLVENNIWHNTNLKIGIDSPFNLECYLNANGIYSIEKPLYNYVYNDTSITQLKYKTNLVDNIANQFEAKKEIYNKYNLTDALFKADFAKYYIENSLFFLINNEKNSPNGLNPNSLSNLGDTDMYIYCFKHYNGFSKNLNIKKKITIYLFKKEYYKILCLIHKVFGEDIKAS